MTYAEALEIKAAIESALLANGGAVSVHLDGRSISYDSQDEMRSALAEINRSILVYERRSANRNPHTSRVTWRR